MKVVVTSSGETMNSPMDPRFGRARMFILVDTESGETRVVDNRQNMNALQGAGIQAAENISRLGAKYLITGHCGPKAFRALKAANIKVFLSPGGTVAEVIQKFKNGELSPSEAPDVEAHWT